MILEMKLTAKNAKTAKVEKKNLSALCVLSGSKEYYD
jgi:hypothetical protein